METELIEGRVEEVLLAPVGGVVWGWKGGKDMGWEKEVEGTEMGGKGMEGRAEEEEGEEGEFWSREETEGSLSPDFKSFEEESLSESSLARLRGGALAD